MSRLCYSDKTFTRLCLRATQWKKTYSIFLLKMAHQMLKNKEQRCEDNLKLNDCLQRPAYFLNLTFCYSSVQKNLPLTVLFYFGPGGRVGERAALGVGPAARGQNQKPLHGPVQLSSRLPHHPHDRAPHIYRVAL